MTTTLTTEQIAELRRLEDSAAMPPWRTNGAWVSAHGTPIADVGDLEFICELRNAAPALLEMAELAFNADGESYRDLWKLSHENVGRIAKRANELRVAGEDVVGMLVQRDKEADTALRTLATDYGVPDNEDPVEGLRRVALEMSTTFRALLKQYRRVVRSTDSSCECEHCQRERTIISSACALLNKLDGRKG